MGNLQSMKWFISALFVCTTVVATAQDHVRFVVTGDDRWNTGKPREGIDENGVIVTGMKRIVAAILAEKPDALLFNGDLVGGGKTDDEELSQFATWCKVMDPIYDAGIKVLAARGNHEMHCPNATDVWKKVFTGKYANPTDGPVGEEGMTYQMTIKNCLFLSIDEFGASGLTGNQEWLDKVLKAPHAPHVFPFAHKMAFFSGNHTDGMWTETEKRDKFINSLVDGGARTVFFGHDHLYDHLTAKLPSWGEDKSIHQFVIGTAGAPFVKGKTPPADGDWQIKHVGHVEQQLGYAVVDVDGMTVRVEFKAEKSPGVFETVDTFSYILTSK